MNCPEGIARLARPQEAGTRGGTGRRLALPGLDSRRVTRLLARGLRTAAVSPGMGHPVSDAFSVSEVTRRSKASAQRLRVSPPPPSPVPGRRSGELCSLRFCRGSAEGDAAAFSPRADSVRPHRHRV